MSECHFWVNVMLRQSRLRASRASPAQKLQGLRVVCSKNFSRATFFVFWGTQLVEVYLSYLPMKQIWRKRAVWAWLRTQNLRVWELEKSPNFSPEILIEFCLWKLFLLELILSFSECTKLLLRNLCIDSVRGEYKFGWDIPVWESWVGMVNWFPKSGWGTVNWLTWGP